MNSLSLGERLVKSIKWLVLFGMVLAYFKPGSATQPPGAALGYLVCIPLYIAIYRILHGRIEDLFDGIGYMFTPDLLSLVFGELREDYLKSAKVALWLGLCFVCGMGINSYYRHAYELIRPG